MVDKDALWTYRAAVERVIDGDTLRIRIDLGFHCYHIESLRLAGVNSPELFSGTNRDSGGAARDFASAWVVRAMLEQSTEWPFIVHTEHDKQTFNRYVGWIIRADTGEDLAEALIAAGHGVRIPV